ncbi:MAG: hypothetical protein IJ035_07680 [Oscillospiraceae bacterium]|nr:hypothetical protein [Oscillospiraceae bacterium]
MIKLRKKLLSAALAAAIAVSAAQVPAWSEEEPAAATEEASNEAAEAAEEEEVEIATKEAAFAAMTKMAETDKLALYVNEDDYTFAVENKANGYKWWSSFYDTAAKEKVQLSRRNTLMTIEVVGTESKAIETARAYDSSVKKKLEKIDNGIKITFTFNKYEIIIPLEITLEDDHFIATVPGDEIVENRPQNTADGLTGYQLIAVNVLENLGAADREDDGIIIVPDGSGAVINYNNNAAAGDVNTYEGKVYGRDLAVGLLQAPAVTEQVTLPVFGRITEGSEDNALVAVASKGEEYASVHAMVTGQNVTDLNNAWFEFALRTTDKYFMGSSNDPLTVYENKGIKTGDVSVSYYPVCGADLTYADVADTYRDYLINDIGVEKITKANDAPFYLTLYGGTVKEQSILGFPVEIQTTATTYEEALKILGELESRGVSNIKIIYEDFNTAGITGKVAATFEYSSKLGGKGDYEKLAAHVSEMGYELFPSCDIMEFENSGNGYSFMLNASKQITNSYATQTPFELAFGLPHETKDSWTILSPFYYTDIFTKLVDSFKKEGAAGISLNQASYTLYSDFSRTNADGRPYFTRTDAKKILSDGYQKLSDNGLTIMTENANQFVLKYADYIKDVPLYSSNYDIFDYDIPFAQMVLHGLVPFSSKAVNKSADAKELRLLSLVTGTPVHYEMMYKRPNKFADSAYDELYYTNYEGWRDIAAAEYKLFNDTIAGVSDSYIEKFERISENEYQSTFENGTTIYVNTDTDEVKVNGTSYDLSAYGLGVSE